jgi:hypothetical protein
VVILILFKPGESNLPVKKITNPGNFYDTHIDHPVGVGFLFGEL